jgi:hypothetical protein
MPPIIGGALRAGKIWIDDALGAAARRRRVALRQRRVAAFVIGGPPGPHMQANRIRRIVRLGPSRRRCQNRRDRQNRQNRNAHQSLLRVMRGAACRSRSGPWLDFRLQADRSLCSQSIHVRAFGAAEWASLGSPIWPSGGSARPLPSAPSSGSRRGEMRPRDRHRRQKFPLAWPSFRLMPSYYRRLYVYAWG